MGSRSRWPRCGGGSLTNHPISCNQERPVEAAPVIGHEPRLRRDERRQAMEEGPLLGLIRQEQLNLPELLAFPPAKAHEEGDGAGCRSETRRLGVQADEGHVGRRLAREARECVPVDGDRARGSFDSHHGPDVRNEDLGVERTREACGELRSALPVAEAIGGSCRLRRGPAEVRESPREECGLGHSIRRSRAPRAPRDPPAAEGRGA